MAATCSWGAARYNAAAATVRTGKVRATRFVAASVVGAVTARCMLIRSGRVGGGVRTLALSPVDLSEERGVTFGGSSHAWCAASGTALCSGRVCAQSAWQRSFSSLSGATDLPLFGSVVRAAGPQAAHLYCQPRRGLAAVTRAKALVLVKQSTTSRAAKRCLKRS